MKTTRPEAQTTKVTFVLRLPKTRPAVAPPAPPSDDRSTVRPVAS